jgi:hypothetical protein
MRFCPYYVHKFLNIRQSYKFFIRNKNINMFYFQDAFPVTFVILKTIKQENCLVIRKVPMWSSGQNSWLQIQRSGFDFRYYQIFWEVVDLERGPLSLVSAWKKK